MEGNSKLEKLTIYIYNDIERKSVENKLEVDINPASYSVKHSNKFQETQGINTSGSEAKYSYSKSAELDLTLVFDSTGVSNYPYDDNDDTGVSQRVNDVIKSTVTMDGDIHEPKYLKIVWGEFLFECRLVDVDIKYTRFNSSGNPVHAELDVQFVEDIGNKKRIRQENKNSPDLTHIRTIKSGDTLPNMVNKIYGSPDYYIWIAEVNKLNNFRKLKPGGRLKFPPLKS